MRCGPSEQTEVPDDGRCFSLSLIDTKEPLMAVVPAWRRGKVTAGLQKPRCRLEASLNYIINSRPARAIQKTLTQNNQNGNNKKVKNRDGD